jgi:DNA-binding NarL/FixJ family response regulator
LPEPAAGEDPSSHRAIATTARAVAGETPQHALRILVVDDHAAVRKALREMLEERSELRVVGDAADGLEAIAQAHALRPDVILMDISMPHMDGVEATRRLRAELPLIQVLALSMQPRTHEPHAIEDAGAVGFYTKGVDTQRLLDRLLAMHVTRSTRPN